MPKAGIAGIFDWFGYEIPIKERIGIIKDAGFDALSLWWEGEDRFEALEHARALGLEIDNIHVPFKNPDSLWAEGENGDAYLALLIACVSDCSDNGIPTAVIHLTGFRTAVPPSPAGLERVRRLTDIAERRGVNLAFENLNRPDTLDFIFKNIDSPRVGFCYDSGHEHCNLKGGRLLERFGNRLFAVHLHDNFGDDDTHLLPFDGNIDWRELMDGLKKCSPLKFLTLEANFNPKHEKSAAYRAFSAEEYVKLARERAARLINLYN